MLCVLGVYYITVLCSLPDIFKRPCGWNTWCMFSRCGKQGEMFSNFKLRCHRQKNSLRHHIISTTNRHRRSSRLPGELISITGVDLSQLDFAPSQPSTRSDKTGRRATIGGAPAAKETLSKPSKCLSRYIGAEVMPGKHLLTSVSLLWESMSPAAKGALLIGMECLYGNSRGKGAGKYR